MATLNIAALDGARLIDPAATRLSGPADGPLFVIAPPTGTGGNDTLNGGAAGEVIDGLGGDDIVNGNGGNDTLLGGAGNDTLDGGEGNDSLNGGPAEGMDSLVGGAGDDTVTVVGGTTKVNTGEDTVALGSGNDLLVLDYSAATEGVQTIINQTPTSDGFFGVLNYFFFEQRLSFSGVERFDVRGGTARDLLSGGSGSDTLSGGDGNDLIFLFFGGAGDVVDGGAGDDQLTAEFAGATTAINFAAGVTTTLMGNSLTSIESLGYFQTGSGNDTVVTSINRALADYVETRGGDDLVTVLGGVTAATTGLDEILMGAGNDTLVLDFSTATVVVEVDVDTTPTGEGFSGRLSMQLEPGGGLQQRATFTGVDRFDIRGGAGDDILRGGSGADTLSGGGGDDLLFLFPGGSGDSVDGGDGNDLVSADFSAATTAIVFAAGVSTTLLGNTLLSIESVGGLRTGSGDDVITTSVNRALSDSIETGAGNDTVIVLGGATAQTTGPDQVDLGDGTDTLVLDFSTATESIATFLQVGQLRMGVFGQVVVGISGAERFDVRGGSGADSIGGAGDADTLTGGAGNDTLDGGGGNDVLNGGPAEGMDSLIGGNGDDTVTVIGGTMAATTGADTVALGAGADTLIVDYSAATEAVAFQQNFADANGSNVTTFIGGQVRLSGSGVNRAVVTGGSAGDSLSDTPGDDILNGGGGDDDLVASLGGTDVLNGGDGNDSLLGFGNISGILNGDAGDDDLNGRGGTAANALNGGVGADRLFVGLGTGADTADGGAGDDALSANYSAATFGIIFAAGVDGVLGDDTIVSVERFSFMASGSGADFITTSANRALADNVITNGGDDTVTVLGGATAAVTGHDTVSLGAGSDTLVLDFAPATEAVGLAITATDADGVTGSASIGGEQRVTFSGADRFDIRAGSAADALTGGAGADSLNGGGGNDTLTGGLGADLLLGDAGADTFVIAVGDSTVAASDALSDFTSGSDRISLTGLTAVSRITIQQGATSSVLLVDNDGDGTVDTQVFVAGPLTAADVLTNTPLGVTLISGAGDQTLVGTAQADTVAAGAGNDQIAGGAGADALFGQDGDDLIFGQDGNDNGFGGLGNDTVIGGTGADTLLGEDGADVLFGEAGADLLVGGAGSDTVYGGLDADTLVGDDGADTLLGEDGADIVFGGAGADQLFGAAGADQMFGGADADLLVGGADNDVLAGETGEDQLFGDAGADQLFGGDGVDSLFGGADGDVLFGGEGGDALNGEDGGDVIVGGAGGDVLAGGAGGDLFVYQLATDSTNAAGDLIVDFTAGQDVIDLSQMDANGAAAGNGTFVFVGAFTGVAGQAILTYDAGLNRSFFQGDVDGNGVADLVIAINGQIGQAGTFLL